MIVKKDNRGFNLNLGFELVYPYNMVCVYAVGFEKALLSLMVGAVQA